MRKTPAILSDCLETTETVITNGVEVLATATKSFHGGGTSTRREWLVGRGVLDPPLTAWTETRRLTAYDAYGRRIDYVVTESSDCGVVTNSATTYDLLGRVISSTVPGVGGAAVTTTCDYDGASSRLLETTTLAGDVGRTTGYLYNDLGERVGTVVDGITNRADVAYEQVSNNWWKVITTCRIAGDPARTNSLTVVREQLTGLSDACRRHVVELVGRGVPDAPLSVTETTVSYDPDTDIETETVTSSVAATVVRRYRHGVLLSTETNGETTSYAYDAFGRVAASCRGAGGPPAESIAVAAYDYAPCGDLMATHTFTNGADAVTETYAYGMLGNRVATTNALGDATFRAYDPLGRVIAEWGATYPILHSYDTQGRRTSLSTTRDELSTFQPFNFSTCAWDETRWGFDPNTGLCTNKTYADGSMVTYTYTPDGKPLRTTYPSGRWKENTYDANRRLVSCRSAGVSPTETNEVFFAYDVFGQRVAESNVVASSVYLRDDRGNCTNDTIAIGSFTNTIERAYDDYGRLTHTFLRASASPCDPANPGNPVNPVQENFASPREIIYAPDGRIAAISNAEAVVEYAYTANRLDAGYTLTLTNGTTFTRAVVRDAYRRNLVLAITNSVNGVAIETLEYAYDALGRPISRNADTFGYNDRSEVVFSHGATENTEYSYDGIGNLLTHSNNCSTNTYTANNLNQYTLCASASLREFSYDADGNLLSNGVFAYAYDAGNRLLSVTSAMLTNGAIRVLNAYDHYGRRVRKTVQRLNSTTPPPPSPPTGTQEWQTIETRTFVYDNWNLAQETISAIDGGATNITEMQYLRGLDLSGALQGAGGVGGLLAVSISNSNSNFSVSQHYFPTYDVNGNITHYYDVQGNVVASYTYDAFGNIIAQSGPMADIFSQRFSTKYFDAETGLYYYGYRFYSPELMRWLNRDPIEEEGGVNLYSFCRNGALINFDSNGLSVVVIKHFSGESPANGWTWPNSRAETKWEYPSYKVYGLPCGKNKIGYYVFINPPITIVNVYFRSVNDSVLAMPAEQQHIDAIIRYDAALMRYKNALESICECQSTAGKIRAQQDAILNQAFTETERIHNLLDAPGGPHGH